MTSRPNVPVIFPSASSIVRSAASHPPGPLGPSSPTSSVLSADSDFSPPVARHFVSFAPRYHRFALFAPPEADDSPGAWTTSIAAPAPPLPRWRGRDLPGSWTTLAYMPRSSTPADLRPQATTGSAMWSSAQLTTSTPHRTLSRLNDAALHALCVRFAAGVTPGLAQHSIPAGGQPCPVRTLTCWVA